MTEPLYINLHIPKTAGYTLRYHIDKNFKYNKKHLLLSFDLLGLSMYKPPKDGKDFKKAAWKYVRSLSPMTRKNIRVIHGHTVPYGIHELFDREGKYFTFVRNPVTRMVSLYNYQIARFKLEGTDAKKRDYYEKYVLFDGKVPDFQTWLTQVYTRPEVQMYSAMTAYLQTFGYLEGEITKTNINEALKKFFFVGKTINYNEESLYLFHKLGMHKFFIDQNISKKEYVLGEDKGVIKKILDLNKMDSYLFDKASVKNIQFKRDNLEYKHAVNSKRLEKMVLMPLTQVAFAPRESIKRVWKFLFMNEPFSAPK